MRPRRALLVGLGLAAALVSFASPTAHADIWANVGPASGLGGLARRYPLGNYELDQHFTAISAGVFSGVDVSGLLPMVAYFFADLAWQGTSWLANIVIKLFAFAFSLDLVNGSGATNGAGALGPVSRAIHSIYASVLGGPWMVVGISVAGLWAMWKALVQRRVAETAGQLALSLIYITAALFFVWQPGQTIGVASQWTNAMSEAFLSIAKDGEPGSQEQAKQAGADQLFGLLVAEPWAVLQFGGLEHCVQTGSGSGESEPTSVPVQPLPAEAARRLEAGEEVNAAGKTCVDNLKKYGDHFLRFAPGSDERNEEFEALQHGDASKLPDADPGKANGSYKLSALDVPAAAAMEKGGQYQRLLVAIVVFVAELGAFCLLGALSIGVILAQVLLLLLLAFSPVALVAAAVPGRGHQFFKAWLQKLAGYLLRKAAYSLILAILLAVCAAIASATSQLGWLLSFGLQCAFFWAVFLQRRSLTEGLVGVVTGPGVPGRDQALGALGLYYGARTAGRAAVGTARTAGSALDASGSLARGAVGRLLGRRSRREAVAPLWVKGIPFGGVRYRKDVGRSGKPPDTARAERSSERPENAGGSEVRVNARELPATQRREPDERAEEWVNLRQLAAERRTDAAGRSAQPPERRKSAAASGLGSAGKRREGSADRDRGAAGAMEASAVVPTRRQGTSRPANSPPAERPTTTQEGELGQKLRADHRRVAGAAEGGGEPRSAGPAAPRSEPKAPPGPPPVPKGARRRRFGKPRKGGKGRRFGKGSESR